MQEHRRSASTASRCAYLWDEPVILREQILTDTVYVARPLPRQRTYLAFSPAEWLRLAGLYGFIAALHVVGWGLYLHYSADHPALIGLGFVAYMFGLRHAFDADHIAAIDDTVRYLLQKGKKPLGIGFFFSLGHSTIVVCLAIGIAFAATAVTHDMPELKNIGEPSALRSPGSSCGSSAC
jgi:high-affinity nickel-transport protein